ncbi:GRB2-associated-binding protein 1 isoform X2 [Aethina tumida]|uniref:GRB2-associated-binding protein 1 isoform X2 n=1 Tax=Aethina tumida TaxID=116153 RepID=UPI00096B0AB1|nr:GRB2-associated-binding protein 1 isoform X2 [Aethina tumida]
MAKSSQEVVFEGWLTKSPPDKRIFRARWRKRYFSLTNTGELPGQYVLTYYTDRHCRKLKGTINLDACEQVDLGLAFREKNLKLDHVFDIKTPTRTYYLAAETEEEMKSWVDNICKVCGLKSSEDAGTLNATDDFAAVEEIDMTTETPPISPVSTNPYIPISECISGKTPVLDPKILNQHGHDFQKLLEYNMRNSFFPNDHHTNEAYDVAPQRAYMNYVNDLPAVQSAQSQHPDPRFYDSPRKLVPPHAGGSLDLSRHEYKNTSPLQSPTDSESVFTDDDWVHNASFDNNTSKNTRPSDSSNDIEIPAAQRFVKADTAKSGAVIAPPRPPKPAHITPNTQPCYLNLNVTPTKSSTNNEEESKPTKDLGRVVVSDEMYDFPRSHNIETETTLRGTSQRRHCYSNAAPANVEGTVFRYDMAPGETTPSLHVDDDEPNSPHSQTSSRSAYSNLPSPLLVGEQTGQLMPPPAVDRGLKPKRKLSDTHSIGSVQEPASPRGAPSVDRKLKPPTPLQEAHMRKTFNPDDERKIRAAPSPSFLPQNAFLSHSLGRSHESLLNRQDNLYVVCSKMQYLDLDLDLDMTNSGSVNKSKPVKENETDTVYKKVDFTKTNAFNLTRNNLEKERQEPVMFKKQ